MTDARPVPAELEDDYEPHRYGDRTFFTTIGYKLSESNPDIVRQLMELSRGGIGEPSN